MIFIFWGFKMKISREEVKHIALLARVGMNEEEIEKFQHQLSDILENFEALSHVNTKDLPPTAQSISLQNVFRTDIAKESFPPSEILANAPRTDANFFKIQAVLE